MVRAAMHKAITAFRKLQLVFSYEPSARRTSLIIEVPLLSGRFGFPVLLHRILGGEGASDSTAHGGADRDKCSPHKLLGLLIVVSILEDQPRLVRADDHFPGVTSAAVHKRQVAEKFRKLAGIHPSNLYEHLPLQGLALLSAGLHLLHPDKFL